MTRGGATILVLGCAVAACNAPAAVQQSGPPAATSASAAPVDHLAPGELLEGKEKAFGLPLPRNIEVQHAFVDVVYATDPAPPDALSNYVRARVREGKVTAGATQTVFDRVKVPARPDREVTIYVRPGGGGRGSELEVHDVTPVKGPDLPDEAARWHAAGLKANGEVLDPQHLE